MSLAVVMATYNGDRFLAAQLDSILAGTLRPDLVLLRDDGSADATPAIIDKYRAARPGLVRLLPAGPRLGAAGSFLHLLASLPEDTRFAALADQDDIWLPERLARARAALEAAGETAPALYCARQILVDAAGRELRLSPLWRRPPSFRNALVENIVTGCTAMLNRPALDLVRGRPLPDVAFHDWWLYLAVTGAGGRVIFDPEPALRYRQHGGNVTGGVVSLRDDLARRARRLAAGASGSVIRANARALAAAGLPLTAENGRVLRAFADLLARPSPRRFTAFRALGLYRQRALDTAILHALFLLGRL